MVEGGDAGRKLAKIEPIFERSIGSRPNWDEYFMKTAISAASRSSCYHVNAGAVITLDNRILGTGYNGASRRDNCLQLGGCDKNAKSGKSYVETLGSGLCIGVHAELNALAYMTAPFDRSRLKIYATVLPCNGCAKTLVSNGIETVVFKSFYNERERDHVLEEFGRAGVKVQRLDLSPERCVDIDFQLEGDAHSIWTPEERDRMRELIEKFREGRPSPND